MRLGRRVRSAKGMTEIFFVKVVSLIAGIDHPSVKHANQHILSKTFKDTKLLSATTAKVLISLSLSTISISDSTMPISICATYFIVSGSKAD